MTRKIGLSVVAAALLTTGAITSVSAADGVNNIKYKLNVRPRMETVTQDNTAEDATALTVKVAQSLSYKNGAIGANLTQNSVIGFTETYKSSASGDSYSVVADPEVSKLTQANVTYTTGKTTAILGRLLLNIDEQRFIGTVGWRQTPQTYDGLFVVDNTIDNLNITAGYIVQYDTIKAAEMDTKSVAFHAAYKVGSIATVSAYSYMIADAHNTTGLKVKGAVPVAGAKISYKVESASQSDPSQLNTLTNAPAVDSSYMAIALGVNVAGISAGFEQETLGDDKDGGAFGTPLATKHKFNGWADIWLATPTKGLVDTMIKLGYKAKGVGVIKLISHTYTSDLDGDDLGSELNLLYVKPLNKSTKVLVKYASYTSGADTTNPDTTKMWLMANYNFAL